MPLSPHVPRAGMPLRVVEAGPSRGWVRGARAPGPSLERCIDPDSKVRALGMRMRLKRSGEQRGTTGSISGTTG